VRERGRGRGRKGEGARKREREKESERDGHHTAIFIALEQLFAAFDLFIG